MTPRIDLAVAPLPPFACVRDRAEFSPHFTLAPAERTTTHLPARFSRRSIQTNSPLVSFPSRILFSVLLLEFLQSVYDGRIFGRLGRVGQNHSNAYTGERN